jgi:hypothetical protein
VQPRRRHRRRTSGLARAPGVVLPEEQAWLRVCGREGEGGRRFFFERALDSSFSPSTVLRGEERAICNLPCPISPIPSLRRLSGTGWEGIWFEIGCGYILPILVL